MTIGDGFDTDCVLSQLAQSLPGDSLNLAKSRHFPRLLVENPVSSLARGTSGGNWRAARKSNSVQTASGPWP